MTAAPGCSYAARLQMQRKSVLAIFLFTLTIGLLACSDPQAEEFEDLRIRYKTISYSQLEQRADNFDTIIARYSNLKQEYLAFVGKYREGEKVDQVLSWLDTINSRQQYWEQLQQDVWARLRNINSHPGSIGEACLTEEMLKNSNFSSVENQMAQRLITNEVNAIQNMITARKHELYAQAFQRERPAIAAQIEQRVRDKALATHAYTQVSAIAGLDTAQSQNGNLVSLDITYDVTLTKKNYALMDAGSTGTMRVRGRALASFTCSDVPKVEYTTTILQNIPSW